MTSSADADRAAIQAAADCLLHGTPLRSTGELTVVQLAVEAGVKRWLLPHKHRDLAEHFQARVRPPPTIRRRSRLSRRGSASWRNPKPSSGRRWPSGGS